MNETAGVIISDDKRFLLIGLESLRHHREELIGYVNANPAFLHILEPISVKEVPEVVRRMSEASFKSGVGPMAAVAGVGCPV